MRNIILSSIGYTLHVIGGLLIIVSIIMFGIVVTMPIFIENERLINQANVIMYKPLYRIGYGIIISFIADKTLKLRSNVKQPVPTNPE